MLRKGRTDGYGFTEAERTLLWAPLLSVFHVIIAKVSAVAMLQGKLGRSP